MGIITGSVLLFLGLVLLFVWYRLTSFTIPQMNDIVTTICLLVSIVLLAGGIYGTISTLLKARKQRLLAQIELAADGKPATCPKCGNDLSVDSASCPFCSNQIE